MELINQTQLSLILKELGLPFGRPVLLKYRKVGIIPKPIYATKSGVFWEIKDLLNIINNVALYRGVTVIVPQIDEAIKMIIGY